MDDKLKMAHFIAGYIQGERPTCGVKVNYISESSANRAVLSALEVVNRKLAVYPCFFCCGWHIGRPTSEAEYQMYFELVDSFIREEDKDD